MQQANLNQALNLIANRTKELCAVNRLLLCAWFVPAAAAAAVLYERRVMCQIFFAREIDDDLLSLGFLCVRVYVLEANFYGTGTLYVPGLVLKPGKEKKD